MPVMSRFEAALCRSAPWRVVAGKVVLPWALQGFVPSGEVLEIGAGGGAMAEQLLASSPAARVTATDFDPRMVDAMAARLAPYGDRADVRQADATALPFPDERFDAVVSWIMLHHTVEWERALGEAARVLRPGGHVVGYDLLSSTPLRLLRPHRAHGSDSTARVRIMELNALRTCLQSLPLETVRTTVSLGGTVVRFSARKVQAAGAVPGSVPA